jgi:hypothetical protein
VLTDLERHQEELKREAAEQAERDRLNAETRKRYLDGLQAKHDAERQRREAEQEAALAPTKERARRQWLYDHPEMTAADFEARAWPLLKANLLEDEREAAIQREMEAMRRRGSVSYDY